jgi:uncharacterized protein (TIGR02145 family)
MFIFTFFDAKIIHMKASRTQLIKRTFIPAITFMLIVLAASCSKSDKGLATVTTSAISDRTLTSARGGGEVTDDGGTLVTARGVCWSAYENPTTADSKTTDGQGTGVFTSDITGLAADEVYFVRAYAINSTGTAYGLGISFTTSLADSGKINFTDARDGHEYKAQVIGTQTWMAENLAYLPAVSGPLAGSDSLPYYYVYGSDSSVVATAKDSANYSIYGVLYNWHAALSACPAGWHLPSDAEWDLLIQTVASPPGGKLKEKGLEHWKTPNTGATNAFGFRALPGGERYSLGEFKYIGEYAPFWSSESRNLTTAWSRHLYFDKNLFDRDYFNKGNGFSVRCLRN